MKKNRKRKSPNNDVLHSKTSVATAEETTSATSSSTATLEVELEDILYRYGDLRDPYLLAKAPDDVIEAHNALEKIRQLRGEVALPLLGTQERQKGYGELDREMRSLISIKCFDFSQKCIMKFTECIQDKYDTIHDAYERLILINAPFGGVFFSWGGGGIYSQGCSCLDLTDNMSTIMSYQTVWSSLLRTIASIV